MLLKARRVHKNKLRIIESDNAQHAIACCLGLFGRNGNFFADNGVYECGLTHIRASDNGDIPTTKSLF